MMMKSKARILASIIMCLPFSAMAHVKWFVNYGVEQTPLSMTSLTGAMSFWLLLAFSTAVIFATSVLDRKLPSFIDCHRCQPFLNHAHNYVPQIVRWGAALFFLVLGAFFPQVILTPELVVANPWLRYIHLIIALTAFSRKTSFFSGFLIILLYLYAVQLYGANHMLDYFIFIGIAVYLITQSTLKQQAYGKELEFLRLILCYSFLWGAIEKFLHPGLYYQLLTTHSYLAMGLNWEFFVRACGFVELCLIWHIFSGRLAGYACIGLFAIIVVLAFIPFGITDFVGHLVFIFPLVALLLTPRKTHLFRTATASTLAFLLTLAILLFFSYTAYNVLQFNLHIH
ncbi:hypothetical protein [Kosakonia radicincitans]|uniref:hypothetical protein n=1 Tax=Kosakonia radicincitans TaxID=283686 RepID=UPI000272DEB2|nr:hypothetical protein [Kosakonia radicincitans]